MAVAPTVVVDKNTVTVYGDIAWFNTPVPEGLELIQGTPLTGRDSLAASYDGVEPIIWRVPTSGTHSITAYGYPDDRMNPDRPEAILEVVITAPTRQQDINAALLEYAQRKFQLQMAITTLRALSPSREELAAAINTN
jgi:hypothetical protein